jgi:solute carrier family 6 amino acid/orphan transporter-like 15/16/17/18/20
MSDSEAAKEEEAPSYPDVATEQQVVEQVEEPNDVSSSDDEEEKKRKVEEAARKEEKKRAKREQKERQQQEDARQPEEERLQREREAAAENERLRRESEEAERANKEEAERAKREEAESSKREEKERRKQEEEKKKVSKKNKVSPIDDGGKKTEIVLSEEKDSGEEKEEEREQYDNLFQYLLATIGFAVGLGNVWRFPKVALENGGGAFIVPWMIVLVIQGIPLMMVELAVGQRFRAGPLHAYGRMNKFMWGVGASMFFASLYASLFYNSILSWAFVYFFNSFTGDLPWLSCPEDAREDPACIANPAKYYFDNSVVNAAPDLDNGSGIVWPLYFATLVAWFVVYLCLFLGLKSVGKVIYFSALYPYLVLTILFFIGVTSDGAEYGLEYLFKPDWTKLWDFRVWQAASEQVFFSASLAVGGMVAMASYMPVKNKTYRDTFVILLINSSTSLFAAFGIFSIKGHTAKDEFTRCQAGEIPFCDTTMTIQDYVADADSSAGLVFISMAKAQSVIASGYGSSVLSMMFYLMIIALGLDSAFGLIEGYLSILKDLGFAKKFGYKQLLTFCMVTSALFSMLFAWRRGVYMIDIFDKYGDVLVLVFVGFFELIAVGWVYGMNNFARDFKMMNGFALDPVMMLLIKYVGPCTIFITLIGQYVMEWKNDTFLTYNDGVNYPWWAALLAMFLFISAVMWFPLAILVTMWMGRLRKAFNWGNVDFDVAELQKDLPVKRYPRWQQVLFFLKEYDFPENLPDVEMVAVNGAV